MIPRIQDDDPNYKIVVDLAVNKLKKLSSLLDHTSTPIERKDSSTTINFSSSPAISATNSSHL